MLSLLPFRIKTSLKRKIAPGVLGSLPLKKKSAIYALAEIELRLWKH